MAFFVHLLAAGRGLHLTLSQLLHFWGQIRNDARFNPDLTPAVMHAKNQTAGPVPYEFISPGPSEADGWERPLTKSL